MLACGTPSPRWGQGNNLIVDNVLCDGEMPEYLRWLSDFDLCLVGVFAPLDVLEGSRNPAGRPLARAVALAKDRVHKNIGYDLEIDTSTLTPLQCARRIKAKFQL
ncbi:MULTISPECIES: hypothetical protein [unclassified Mesorhizobium]|uniref:phosphotransferase-like protein n=1 Tax=unclassified Mesorhizobium TaxID=325217 RepID=UPI0013E32987|nr:MULTISPECIES: hypothetical protein [unclassified Mesorhizobium]